MDTGMAYPPGTGVRVGAGAGTGRVCPTRELQNKPKNALNGQELTEIQSI